MFGHQLTSSSSSQDLIQNQKTPKVNLNLASEKAQKKNKILVTSTPQENKPFKNVPSVNKPLVLVQETNGRKRSIAATGEQLSNERKKSLVEEDELFVN